MSRVLEQTSNAVRVLSAEAIQAANSGHPGLPLGAAPMAVKLWADHMAHNPANPNFFNRDRFVLSAGHGSMLLYSLLHIFGYGMTKEDLMSFRQLNSRTPGHPEYGHTVGVETSTGPLGQGFANAVGMAQAEKTLAARFNRGGINIVDHYTYALCGDGCMMEGIENEAASLAGTWELGKLICFYDCNNITIEGDTNIAFRENVGKRHEALGWQVINVPDGNDFETIGAAITLAKSEKKKPSLIIVKTTIGYGSPNAGTPDVHGSPLGEKNIEALKKNLGWKEKPFETPKEVTEYIESLKPKFSQYEEDWKKILRAYKKENPELYDEFMTWISKKSFDIKDQADIWKNTDKADATRNSGGIVLNKIAKYIPNLTGGAADLAPSTKTYMKDKGEFSAETPEGQNMHFGIREHAMAAIANGMYLHGGLNVFCSTFFVFSDYMKGAVRMAALMGIPVTYILTHDSIGVGEDGPTHQPVEQLIALRSIPNLKVFRPCDYKETAAAYISAFTGNQPTAIVLTRQNLAQQKLSGPEALKGAYIVRECEGETPDIILMASGSEVDLTIRAAEELKNNKINARVVSVPCMELFDAQPNKYKEAILPAACRARLAVEAGSSYSWHKYTGLDGAVISMDTFGTSAPADKLFEIYGFSMENVVKEAVKVVKKNRKL